jgi:CRP/FNR family transcriptional regulator, cyclic AMP receptor protein
VPPCRPKPFNRDTAEYRLSRIRTHSMLSGLPAQVQRALAEESSVWTFDVDDLIIQQGEETDELLFITKGHVAVYTTTPLDRRRVYLSYSTNADVVGEFRYFNGQPHGASVIALEAGSLLKVAHSDVQAYLEKSPDFMYALCQEFVTKLARNADQIAVLNAGSTYEQRILAAVTILADRRAKEEGSDVHVGLRKIGRYHLADIARCSVENVSRVIASLEEHGYIDYDIVERRYEITVLDVPKLRSFTASVLKREENRKRRKT